MLINKSPVARDLSADLVITEPHRRHAGAAVKRHFPVGVLQAAPSRRRARRFWCFEKCKFYLLIQK